MKTLFITASMALSAWTGIAQECKCPNSMGDGAETSKTFHFSNGRDMVICGFVTVEGEDVSYTNFSLYRCGDSKPLEHWDASITCKPEQTKDALLIKEMYNLPVGQSFSTLWRPFYIHKFTFRDDKVEETEYYDKQLPRYNKEQIAAVMQQYNELTQPANEQTMKVANMLFWAAVSGCKETEALLKSLPGKFGPFSGPIADEWKEINARYEQWKNRKP